MSTSDVGPPPRSRRQWYAIALTAGILAGGVAWLIGEATLEVFKPTNVTTVFLALTFVGPSTESRNEALFKNSVLAYACLGGLAGLALGIAGGVASRSIVRGLIVGGIALLLGSLAGALAAMGLLPIFFRHRVPDPNDLLTPIIIYGGISVVISGVGGAAFAIASGTVRRAPEALVAACLGAVWSTIMFFIFTEYFVPDSNANEPLAGTPMVRLLSKVMLLTMTALCAAWATQGKLVRPPATQSSLP